MKTFIFKTPTKLKYIEAKTVKSAFLKLSKTDKTSFQSVFCEDTGEYWSDTEVFYLFGYEISL